MKAETNFINNVETILGLVLNQNFDGWQEVTSQSGRRQVIKYIVDFGIKNRLMGFADNLTSLVTGYWEYLDAKKELQNSSNWLEKMQLDYPFSPTTTFWQAIKLQEGNVRNRRKDVRRCFHSMRIYNIWVTNSIRRHVELNRFIF